MQESNQSFAVDVETIYGTRLRFRNDEEVVEFLRQEQATWAWLEKPLTQTNPAANIKQTINAHFAQIGQHIPTMRAGNPTAITAAMREAFNKQRVPLSTSPIASFVKDAVEESPHQAALYLAAWMNPGWLTFNSYDHVKAAFLTAAFDAHLHPRTGGSVKRSLEKLIAQFSDAKAQVETETDAQRKRYDEAEAKHRRTVKVLQKLAKRQASRFQAQKDGEIAAAIQAIRETEAVYKEQMRLQAPVDYWSQKARDHRTAAANHRWNLIWFSIGGALTVVLSLLLITKYARSFHAEEVPAIAYVTLGTLGIVITTIGFWIARILTRLFLSEHHLSIDAEERAVMAKTYLALTAAGRVDEKERGLVLASLFRPTADGIVKDDAAPDLTPAALVSKVLAR